MSLLTKFIKSVNNIHRKPYLGSLKHIFTTSLSDIPYTQNYRSLNSLSKYIRDSVNYIRGSVSTDIVTRVRKGK